MSLSTLPAWPPKELAADERNLYVSRDARDYALGHGLVYRALPEKSGDAPPPDVAIHAPTTLVPTPFPRILFERALRMQPIFNELYARVAMDDDFLTSVMKDSVIKVDDFQRRLFDTWVQAREEGITQPMHLGLFRSDYLMNVGDMKELSLQQVEFNTISSSFGALCTRVSKMHHHLMDLGAYEALDSALVPSNLPMNDALDTLTLGLADAHRHYVEMIAKTRSHVQPRILFVVQGDERNTFDQRAMEEALTEQHNIPVLRSTFEDLRTKASLHGGERVLVLQTPLSVTPVEISVVYYRSGYNPDDYALEEDWAVRLMLERSLAIKCPTIALQLAGAKKVQQALAEPGVLERFVGNNAHDLRLMFAQLWPLDDSELGKEALRLVREDPTKYVMKPQREGGSHNIYKEDILPALEAMEKRDKERAERGEDVSVKEREGYILMSMIRTPEDRGALMLRAGHGDRAEVVEQTVSELGIYGTALFGLGEIPAARAGGFLLRTKASSSNEGGVAVGFSVIDTPVLV